MSPKVAKATKTTATVTSVFMKSLNDITELCSQKHQLFLPLIELTTLGESTQKKLFVSHYIAQGNQAK